MDIKNCKKCGRLYQYVGNKYCPSCIREIDEMFIVVKDYVYDHPNASILTVSEETGVDEEIILEFLREGRLELKSPSIDFVCERCGKPITTGRYCSECLTEIDRGLKKGFAAPKASPGTGRDSDKMYISEYHKKRNRTK